MDYFLPPSKLTPHPGQGGLVSRRHPLPGSIMGELCTAPAFVEGAEALWRAPISELRLTEQVPIRTDCPLFSLVCRSCESACDRHNMFEPDPNPTHKP